MPDCRIELFEDANETDDATLVGENCHIVAESDAGPRAVPEMPADEREKYNNLILLCRNHHKIVDSQPLKYTVEVLVSLKREHESWVNSQLQIDRSRQRSEETYSGFIDEWCALAHLNEWEAWTSALLSNGQPSLRIDIDGDLLKLRQWLLTRIWPGIHVALEHSFENFRRVLQDLQETFRRHAEQHGDEELITSKFYKIPDWDEVSYKRLSRQFDFHVDLVEDLTLELTRAANLVCDRIRETIHPGFRMQQGHLAIMSGPNFDFKWQRSVVQYSSEEKKTRNPYQGLEDFYDRRSDRDLYFGEGSPPL